MQKICVVEDDDNIRDMLLYALSSAGFDARGFADGEGFWAQAEKWRPSLLLLDIMLPGEDGLAILTRLKQSGKYGDLPVVLLTAKGSEYDRIKGLDLGADDYVTKPFSVLEVISRVKAVLRRCSDRGSASLRLQVQDVVLDPERRTVLAGGEDVLLTYREFELFMHLMRNEGVVLSRDRLLEQVWGFDYNGESRTVDMHIRSLRRKLGKSGDVIKTIRNVGYSVRE